jgi:VanZ family protein
LYHGAVPLKYWLPLVVWMAAIITFSSDVGSGEHTGGWILPLLRLLAPWATNAQLDGLHWLLRKAGHIAEYAILTALWYRALGRGRGATPRGAAAIAFTFSVAWGVIDEIRQSFVPSRTASAIDVATDSLGAMLVVTVAILGWRTAIDRLTTTLLWIALLGGAAFLTLNTLTGVPSGTLWLTAPLAALLLLARRLYFRSAYPTQRQQPQRVNQQPKKSDTRDRSANKPTSAA